ncbi:MAG TPA: hypothetical protein VIH42_09055 [Thermoguttaceae bacterium]
MKYVMMILAVVVMFAGQSLAADQGNLSQNELAKLGLSNMSIMNDAQGTMVRGMGFSVAWGKSSAHVRGAESENGYFAVDSGHRGSLAGGANLSFAGSIEKEHRSLDAKVVFAGGASIAFTK